VTNDMHARLREEGCEMNEEGNFICYDSSKKETDIVAVLYTNGNIECDRIRMLLKSLGGEFLEYLLGIDFSDRQFRMEFGSEAEYPQITINGKHIGSLKETLNYFKQEEII